MSRVRSAAQRAPQTIEAATALCARFAERSAAAALIIQARDETIAKANQTADTELVPITAELKDIEKQLKPFFAAKFDELTCGKRKSIELGGCYLGYRLDKASVAFAHGKDDDMAVTLRAAELTDYVRTKHSPDKPAIMKALEGERDAIALRDAESVAPIGHNGGEAIDDGAAAAEPVPSLSPLHDIGFSIKQGESFFLERVGQDRAVEP
ncbi:Mu-like prophage host-nuclease inhibitor protein Gam [Sphingobium sp. AP50]|uniref:host-nuclease inhibitor Gam family protein n=1 Tax=Sphingobium sp. AP50 TaxID=1884369 RepID=UPI0008C11A82|nr:host-nuclease inhibitor Gam family protein [Sphingobium sp. AP50]SEI68716.1 Mu-like prophage host-nuclease inhibitor protein Gam [Sphingobium sp. AP50]